MKKILTLFILCLFISFAGGCSTLLDDFFQKVDYSDGIDAKEALYLVKERFQDNEQVRRQYNLSETYIVDDEVTAKYPTIWFIQIPSRQGHGYYFVRMQKENGLVLAVGAK